MGRPERPIDPEAGPVQAFGSELRSLREAAGRPKYVSLAQRTGRSQSTLSDAAGGQRFPTWETVEAFVRACNGDVDQWRGRWSQTAAAIRGLPIDTDAAEDTPTAHQAIRRTRVVVAAGTLAVVVGLVVTAVWRPWASVKSAQRPAAIVQAADGADPKQSGCAYGSDVMTLDSAEVDQDAQPKGLVELRYAPECGTVWARFTPLSDASIRPGTAIHVDVERPGDNRHAPFEAPWVGAPVYGGMLRNTDRCVIAQAWLGTGTVAAKTNCFRGRMLATMPH